jgi:hypothetical protein
MAKHPFCNFFLAGVALTDYGLVIPSPFTSLSLSNSEISSMTQWTLECIVGGDDKRRINISAFEALLYTSAQNASNYSNSSGIPVSFLFGWLDDNGSVLESLSYQGFTLTFKVSTSGRYMKYSITGYASLAIQTSLPVLRVPELSGIVQPSAVVEGLAIAVKATNYYDLDIDHCDQPTLVNHGAMTTSFNSYVRGTYSGKDDYETFPGLLKLSKSYNASRDSAGLDSYKVRKLSQAINNRRVSPLSNYLKTSFTDTKPQSSSFSYWVDEPTMTSRGCIHYKSNAGLLGTYTKDTLEYGTANTNVLTLSGSYNGVAYNMTNMNYTQVGFNVDGSGNTIAQDYQVVNSWSSTLADVFQSANIINDVNAIASQFSGDFTVTIPGSTKKYNIAQTISLLVMSGNTISPITGIYNIISVSHDISSTFVTTLKLQRLVMSSANQVAAQQGILIRGSSSYPKLSYAKTKNIISTSKVDFGTIYPDFTYMSGTYI